MKISSRGSSASVLKKMIKQWRLDQPLCSKSGIRSARSTLKPLHLVLFHMDFKPLLWIFMDFYLPSSLHDNNWNPYRHEFPWQKSSEFTLNTIEELYNTKNTRKSVPSSELGPPPPLPQASVSPPWNGGGRGQNLLAGEGKPFRLTGEKAWHSVYSVQDTHIKIQNLQKIYYFLNIQYFKGRHLKKSWFIVMEQSTEDLDPR